ncbi:MAG: alkaline shock response membrane anchor protein AmaP, partial [Actinobacteria bacterium]|nr:alkaline shock response membrane anchor protein AmaP [Actinomycetota bacterium]
PRPYPQLHLRVTTDDRADITGLRRQIDTDAIPRLCRALDLPALPADLLLRLDTTSGARIR